MGSKIDLEPLLPRRPINDELREAIDRMAQGAQSNAWAKYLAPTAEAFHNLLRLLGCDRTYRSPIYDRLAELLCDDKVERLLVLMPRGSYKSTYLEASVIRDMYINPNIRILYSSETLQQAKAYTGWVKAQAEENHAMVDELGMLYDPENPKRWAAEAFYVVGRNDLSKKEATVTAKGMLQLRAGPHYDKIIMDDWVSVANSRTKEGIETAVSAFKHLFSIAEAVQEGGKIVSRTKLILNGTTYDDADVYSYVRRMNKELEAKAAAGDKTARPWTVFCAPAEIDGQFPYKQLPEEVCRQLKTEQGARVYNAQYMLDPVPTEDAMFNRTQFRVIRHSEIPIGNLWTYLLTDTATSEDRSDYTVLAVVGRDSNGRDYLLDMMWHRFNPTEVRDNIFGMYDAWTCRHAVMEKAGINNCYGAMIDEKCRLESRKLKIVGIPRTTTSKIWRVQALQPPLEAGTFFISDRLPQNLVRVERTKGHAFGELVDQFLRFPRGQHDDIPDALADLYARDSFGTLVCPRPPARKQGAQQQPTVVNGKLVLPTPQMNRPGLQRGGGDFWGNLASRRR